MCVLYLLNAYFYFCVLYFYGVQISISSNNLPLKAEESLKMLFRHNDKRKSLILNNPANNESSWFL